MLVAVPFGIGTAIYLAEYARPRVRRVVKPIIEVLAGMPIGGDRTVRDQVDCPQRGRQAFDPTQSLNMLVAGLGIGILVIPIMASVSEDALSCGSRFTS